MELQAMTLTMAALVLTNLVYVVGAVVVASLVSGLYVLLHRKPKSLESGIESFSRELRALAPERAREATAAPARSGVADVWVQPAARTRAADRRRPRGAVATAARRAPATPAARADAPPDGEVDATNGHGTGAAGPAGADDGRAAGPDDGDATTFGGRSG
jgi:hypothetical protein